MPDPQYARGRERQFLAFHRPVGRSGHGKNHPERTVVLSLNATVYRLTPAEADALAGQLRDAAEAGRGTIPLPPAAKPADRDDAA